MTKEEWQALGFTQPGDLMFFNEGRLINWRVDQQHRLICDWHSRDNIALTICYFDNHLPFSQLPLVALKLNLLTPTRK